MGSEYEEMLCSGSALISAYCIPQNPYLEAGLYLSDFHWRGGGSEFRLAMTDRATIAGMEVAKLVPWNTLLN